MDRLRDAIARYGRLDGVVVDVGVQSVDGATPKEAREAAASGRQPTLAEVAAANEFGVPTQGVPARPFLRQSGKQYRARWVGLFRTAVKRAVERDDETGFRVLGVATVADVKAKLTSGPWEPNASLTVERKGSDRPLIDTGQLRNSIRAAVRVPGSPSVLVG